MAANGTVADLLRCDIPIYGAPPGMTSNLVDPSTTMKPALTAVVVVTTTLAVVVTSARVYVNFKKLHAADYFAVIGTCIMFGLVYSVYRFMEKFGRHMWDVPACWMFGENFKTYTSYWNDFTYLYGVTSFFSKASVFLLYYQIFSSNTTMKVCIYAGMFVLTATFWSSIPPASTVLITTNPNKRLIIDIISIPLLAIQGIVAVALDVFIFLLPIPLIVRMRIPRAKRIQLALVFGTALIAVACSTISVVYRMKILPLTSNGKQEPDDYTWYQSIVLLTVINENNIAIAVSGAPAFRAFLSKMSKTQAFKSVFPTGRRKGANSTLLPGFQDKKGKGGVFAVGKGKESPAVDPAVNIQHLDLPNPPTIGSAPKDAERLKAERRRRGLLNTDDELSLGTLDSNHGGMNHIDGAILNDGGGRTLGDDSREIDLEKGESGGLS